MALNLSKLSVTEALDYLTTYPLANSLTIVDSTVNIQNNFSLLAANYSQFTNIIPLNSYI
jgi:hypothetical protein